MACLLKDQGKITSVAEISSVRIIFAIVLEQNLHLNQFDKETVYLNGGIDEEIHIKKTDKTLKHVREILARESESINITIKSEAKVILTDH